MKVPKKTPSDASNTHGLPCISSTIPQPMKQVNSRNTRMASANFITADCSRFARTRKPGGNQSEANAVSAGLFSMHSHGASKKPPRFLRAAS